MASASGPLGTYLSEVKAQYLAAVKAGPSESIKWTIAMGNEAGDLDSLACSIAYARYCLPNPAIPLIFTRRNELRLRAENLHALSICGIQTTDILCLDDVTDQAGSGFPSRRFALLDHNKLLEPFSSVPDCEVVAVVDHHADEGLYAGLSPDKRLIAPTGSCSSHVGNILAQLDTDIDNNICKLLLCAILIDTHGLKSKSKTTPIDSHAVQYLLKLPTSLTNNKLPEAIEQLSATLAAEKEDLSALGTVDILRRDYKEYLYDLQSSLLHQGRSMARVGLSSGSLALEPWIKRELTKFWPGVLAFMGERNLDILGILPSFKGPNGSGTREQFWVVKTTHPESDPLPRYFFSELESSPLKLKKHVLSLKGFGIEKKGANDGVVVHAYEQGECKLTRKFTAPLVKVILTGDRE